MSALRLLSPIVLPPTGPAPTVVGCVRNERMRLPFFLSYYRRLGVSRFLLIDNASDDGTLEFLAAQADVSIFSTEESYSASLCGVRWINSILDAHCVGSWALVVDADELFVFPGSDRVDLAWLTNHLDSRKEEGVESFMLDMYSQGPISEARYNAGRPFLEVCPFFDSDSYEYPQHDLYTRVPLLGGPRKRLFWGAGAPRSPFLGKFPLIKWRQGLSFEASTHLIRGVRLSEVTGVLLHFKFFADFESRAHGEAARGEHWDNAHQYKTYADGIGRFPRISAYYAGSARYRDPDQLVELGLMQQPADFHGALTTMSAPTAGQ
jgi:hypothetical protein